MKIAKTKIKPVYAQVFTNKMKEYFLDKNDGNKLKLQKNEDGEQVYTDLYKQIQSATEGTSILDLMDKFTGDNAGVKEAQNQLVNSDGLPIDKKVIQSMDTSYFGDDLDALGVQQRNIDAYRKDNNIPLEWTNDQVLNDINKRMEVGKEKINSIREKIAMDKKVNEMSKKVENDKKDKKPEKETDKK